VNALALLTRSALASTKSPAVLATVRVLAAPLMMFVPPCWK
jgi:hypothetical protein